MRVIIESPYSGKTKEEVDQNEKYLNEALAHSLSLGEAPFASHGLYTRPGVLDDTCPEQRRLGIDAGFMWRCCSHLTVVYGDMGITRGMVEGIEHSIKMSVPVRFRKIRGTMNVKKKFDELAALEWLLDHPGYRFPSSEQFKKHMSMMFGGEECCVHNWNERRFKENFTDRPLAGCMEDNNIIGINNDFVMQRIADIKKEPVISKEELIKIVKRLPDHDWWIKDAIKCFGDKDEIGIPTLLRCGDLFYWQSIMIGISFLSPQEQRAFACAGAEYYQERPERSSEIKDKKANEALVNAIETAKRYTKGEVGKKELSLARRRAKKACSHYEMNRFRILGKEYERRANGSAATCFSNAREAAIVSSDTAETRSEREVWIDLLVTFIAKKQNNNE